MMDDRLRHLLHYLRILHDLNRDGTLDYPELIGQTIKSINEELEI